MWITDDIEIKYQSTIRINVWVQFYISFQLNFSQIFFKQVYYSSAHIIVSLSLSTNPVTIFVLWFWWDPDLCNSMWRCCVINWKIQICYWISVMVVSAWCEIIGLIGDGRNLCEVWNFSIHHCYVNLSQSPSTNITLCKYNNEVQSIQHININIYF